MAGQELLDAPFPNHIVLDLNARQLSWYSAFQDKVDQEAFTSWLVRYRSQSLLTKKGAPPLALEAEAPFN